MINILKGKSLLAAVLMAVLMLQGCARFRDIRIVSCGVESVSMQGLRSVEAILSVGVDNPAAALELSGIEGTLNMGDDVLGTFSAGNFSIDRKTVSECQVPVSFTLDRQVSLLSLLPLVRELDPDSFSVDMSLRVKVKNGVSRKIRLENVPVSYLFKDSSAMSGIDFKGIFL